MGKPYSQDFRERVIAAVDTGTGAYVAALLFQVSVSYIYKALIRRRKTGASDRAPVRLRSESQSWRRTIMPFVHALRPSPTPRSPNCRLGYSSRAQGQCQHRLPVEQAAVSQTPAQKKSERAAEQDRLGCGPSA